MTSFSFIHLCELLFLKIPQTALDSVLYLHPILLIASFLNFLNYGGKSFMII